MNDQIERQILEEVRENNNRLSRIETLLSLFLKEGFKIMQELDDLKAQAQKTEDTEQAAILVLKGLADQIIALKTDPAALTELANGLKKSSDDLASAIATPPPA